MLRGIMLLVCVCAAVITGAAARQDSGNFLDSSWPHARWDKFRDEAGSWIPGKPLDQALDPAKDPCLKIKCGRHKQCVAEDYKTPTCVSQASDFGHTNCNRKCAECEGTTRQQQQTANVLMKEENKGTIKRG
ncbi:Testican-3 [Bagarius yarrelli]|uniref:Testican-3 n=1 Tax=Bagarius yarrelli TaxID=175774 RepID=A0A556UG29_BAGYA|nr:Testican-3 [Bagarius yarrelli]